MALLALLCRPSLGLIGGSGLRHGRALQRPLNRGASFGGAGAAGSGSAQARGASGGGHATDRPPLATRRVVRRGGRLLFATAGEGDGGGGADGGADADAAVAKLTVVELKARLAALGFGLDDPAKPLPR